MKKGSRCNAWTISELQYLMANAGVLPRREICMTLRRSTNSVKQKVKYLNSEGIPLSLRCHVPKLATCPSCGRLSATLGKVGICRPCRQREQLATIQARIAEMWPKLSPEDRRTYEKSERLIESFVDPMPKAPDTSRLSRYGKAKAEERHEIAMEQWTIRNLNRLVKAAQKRKERIQKKLK